MRFGLKKTTTLLLVVAMLVLVAFTAAAEEAQLQDASIIPELGNILTPDEETGLIDELLEEELIVEEEPFVEEYEPAVPLGAAAPASAEVDIDLTDLEALITEAHALLDELAGLIEEEELFKKIPVGSFNDALASAEEVYGNAEATQDEIDNASSNLEDMITLLQARIEFTGKWAEVTSAWMADPTGPHATPLLNAMVDTNVLNSKDPVTLAEIQAGIATLDNVLRLLSTTFTVTFDTQGGSTVEPQTVEEGEVATKPADPVKEGFIFLGWYDAAEGGTEWNFETYITKDVTIFAQWEEEVVDPLVPALVDGWYQIATPDHLLWFAEQVNSGQISIKGLLISNIDMTGKTWTPISNVIGRAFTGTFDGNGKTITLNHNGGTSNDQGLFGFAGNNAVIKNVTVAGSISGWTAAGIVCNTTNSSNGATIENCVNKATITGSSGAGGIVCTVSGYNNIKDCVNEGTLSGGVVGGIIINYNFTFPNSTPITNCINKGVITATGNAGGICATTIGPVRFSGCQNTADITGNSSVGGIIGTSTGGSGSINMDKCFNTGAITSNYTSNLLTTGAGGLVGSGADNGSLVTMSNSYNTGAVGGTARCVGGLVGYVHNYNYNVTNSYNRGDVSSTCAQSESYAGGIVAYVAASSPTMTNCYNSGEVTGATNLGSIAGRIANLTNVNNNYYLSGTADLGMPGTADVEGKLTVVSETQLNKLAKTLGAAYKTGFVYPILQWQPYEVDEPVTTFTVAFDVDGVTTTLEVEEGEVATKPADPVKEGFIFLGWYNAAEGGTEWNFETPITKDVTLYAYWEVEVTGPFEIASWADLLAFAARVNGGEANIEAIVTADITQPAGETWTPIGIYSIYGDAKPFSGEFDGGEHTITLNHDGGSSNYQALFGYTDGAVIENITMAGSIKGWNNIGSIAGTAKNTTFQNCINLAAITGAGSIGGIVGTATDGAIIDCENHGIITSTFSSMVGGIAGYVYSASGTPIISGCVNTAAVNATNASSAEIGGIVGAVATVTVEDCQNSGPVSGAYEVGGIVGKATHVTLNQCANTAAVTASNTAGGYHGVGGIVGYTTGHTDINECYNSGHVKGYCYLVGGIIGGINISTTSPITNCYNVGIVEYTGTSNGSHVGGIIGRMADEANTMTNCYNAGEIINGATTTNFGSVIGNGGAMTNITNNYYLEGTASSGKHNQIDVANKLMVVNEAALKGLAGTLGDAYESGINYPVLKWQDEGVVLPTTFTVTFDVDGVTTTLEVEENGVAVQPADPVKEGFIFLGWFDVATDGTEWNFETPITEDITLYAYWEEDAEDEYDVILTLTLDKASYKAGETITITSSLSAVNSAVALDAATIVLDYDNSILSFTGYTWLVDNRWHLTGNEISIYGGDKDGRITCLFSKYSDYEEIPTGGLDLLQTEFTVTEDLSEEIQETIVEIFNALVNGANGAKVGYEVQLAVPLDHSSSPPTFTVTFDVDGVTTTLEVEENGVAVQPADPVKEGFIFLGWFDEAEGGTEWNFETPITKDVTLYAYWEEKVDPNQPTIVDGWYQIATVEHLNWFAAQVNSGNNVIKGKLIADIVTNTGYTPIGTFSPSMPFKGEFDGDGHAVELGIYSSSSYQGLFGYVNGGSVKNVTVGGSVTGGENTGGIVGFANGGTTISGCVNNATITGSYHVGGILGRTANSVTVNQCANTGAIISTGADTTSRGTGGVVGYIAGTTVINECYNSGKVDGTAYAAGGITGATGGGSKICTITNCYNVGEVNYIGTNTSRYAGGIVGLSLTGDPVVENCYNAGAIGGITGTTVGGVIASGGAMTTIINNFYLEGTAALGKAGVADETGKLQVVTEAQLKGLAGTLGTVYEPGINYPVLKWQDEGVVLPTTFTVTFDVDGVTTTLEVEENGVAVQPADPVKEGFIFLGWFDEAEGGTEWNFETPITEDVTLYAYWEEEITGPYEISTWDELLAFAAKVNGGETDLDAIVTADITQPVGATWTPIGTFSSSMPFIGNFDGGEHTITLGYADDATADYQGLFGYVNGGTIKNVTISGTVSGGNYVGAIVGYAYNCTMENCTNNAAVYGRGRTGASGNTGGIAGYAGAASTFKNCTNLGHIEGIAPSGAAVDVGGIVGHIRGANNIAIEIIDCVNRADIAGVSSTGGIVGTAFSTTTYKITDCYNYGNITATGSSSPYIAGIIACSTAASGTIERCLNEGIIKTTVQSGSGGYAGGIVGSVSRAIVIDSSFNTGKIDNVSRYGAGIAGYVSSDSTPYVMEITNCYNTGDVTAWTFAGGIVSYMPRGSLHPIMIANCYNSGAVGTLVADGYDRCGSILGDTTSSAGLITAGKIINNYYLEGTALAGVYNKVDNPVATKSVTTAELRASGMPAIINKDAYKTGAIYPILQWQDDQDPQPITYTVTFDTQGGSAVAPLEVEEGGVATKPANPTKNGVVFVGWFDAATEGTEWNFETPITEDITLYAQWKSYLTAVAEIDVATPGNVAVLNLKVTNSAPSLAIVRFTYDNNLGWPVTLLNNLASINAGQTITRELYIEIPDDVDFDELDGLTLTFTVAVEYTYPGHQASVTVSAADLVVPAPPTFTVAFDVDGEEYDVQEVEENGVAVQPADPVKEGFIFLGWFDAATDGTEWNFETPITEDVTLYAYWEVDPTPVKDGDWYLLSNVDELLWFADQVNGGAATIKGKLTADIDMTETGFTSIGTSYSVPFSGELNGDGHYIMLGLGNGSVTNLGLFAYLIDAKIENVTIKGTVYGWNNVGGIAGYATNSSIKNCHNEATIKGISYLGGIAGSLSGTSVINCSNTGTISGISGSTSNSAAGIVGMASNFGEISNCTNTGAVESGGYNVGGIAGITTGTGSIFDCHNTVDIKGAYHVGGIVGNAYNSGGISQCSNTGNISNSVASTSASHSVGGIVGALGASGYSSSIDNCYNTGAISGTVPNIGGIAGYSTMASNIITNCYNLGSVAAKGTQQRAGGIVAYPSQKDMTIANCYSSGQITGTNAGGIAGWIGEAMPNLSNTYYLSGTANKGVGGAAVADAAGKVEPVSAATLKYLAPTLGAAYKEGSTYPILKWQTGETLYSEYTVVLEADGPTDLNIGDTLKVNVMVYGEGLSFLGAQVQIPYDIARLQFTGYSNIAGEAVKNAGTSGTINFNTILGEDQEIGTGFLLFTVSFKVIGSEAGSGSLNANDCMIVPSGETQDRDAKNGEALTFTVHNLAVTFTAGVGVTMNDATAYIKYGVAGLYTDSTYETAFTIPTPVAESGYMLLDPVWNDGTNSYTSAEIAEMLLEGGTVFTAQAVKVWNVAFYDAEGVLIDELQTVADGGFAVAPADPVAPVGMSFAGWFIVTDADDAYVDQELLTSADIAELAVTADVSYKAHFSHNSYALAYDEEAVEVLTGEGPAGFATHGTDVTFQLLNLDSSYDYAVSYTVGGEDMGLLTAVSGVYTIEGDDIIGDVEITVTQLVKGEITFIEFDEYLGAPLNFKVALLHIAGTDGEPVDGVAYLYNGKVMFWSAEYDAYAYFVDSELDELDALARISISDDTQLLIAYDGDVNRSNAVNITDATIISNLYKGLQSYIEDINFKTVNMLCRLEADVNGDGTVDGADVRLVQLIIIGE